MCSWRAAFWTSWAVSAPTFLGHTQDLAAVWPGQALDVMRPDLNQRIPLNGQGLKTAMGNILELGESQDTYIYAGLCWCIRLFLSLFTLKNWWRKLNQHLAECWCNGFHFQPQALCLQELWWCVEGKIFSPRVASGITSLLMSVAELTLGFSVNFVESFLRFSKAGLNAWIWVEEASTRTHSLCTALYFQEWGKEAQCCPQTPMDTMVPSCSFICNLHLCGHAYIFHPCILHTCREINSDLTDDLNSSP